MQSISTPFAAAQLHQIRSWFHVSCHFWALQDGIYSSLKLPRQLLRGLNFWIPLNYVFFSIIFRPFQDSFTAQMPGLCISWLVAGGLLYTGGVPFFMLADYRPLCHWIESCDMWCRLVGPEGSIYCNLHVYVLFLTCLCVAIINQTEQFLKKNRDV